MCAKLRVWHRCWRAHIPADPPQQPSKVSTPRVETPVLMQSRCGYFCTRRWQAQSVFSGCFAALSYGVLIRTWAPADNCTTRCARLWCFALLFANCWLSAIVLQLLCCRETIRKGNFSCFIVYSDADENNSAVSDIKGGPDTYRRFLSLYYPLKLYSCLGKLLNASPSLFVQSPNECKYSVMNPFWFAFLLKKIQNSKSYHYI